MDADMGRALVYPDDRDWRHDGGNVRILLLKIGYGVTWHKNRMYRFVPAYILFLCTRAPKGNMSSNRQIGSLTGARRDE